MVEASAKLITPDQPGYHGGMMNLVMMLRLEGLFRMKMFDELIVEANKIITAEDSRLQPYFEDNDEGIIYFLSYNIIQHGRLYVS